MIRTQANEEAVQVKAFSHQRIIELLVRHGGFSNRRAVATAYRLFCREARRLDFPLDMLIGSNSVLSTWAVCAVESGQQEKGLQDLYVALGVIGESFSNSNGNWAAKAGLTWIGRLALVLLSLGDVNACRIDLYELIKEALIKELDQQHPDAALPSPDEWLSSEMQGPVVADDLRLEFKPLDRTKKVLLQLGEQGAIEAYLVLVLLRAGSVNERRQWLEIAQNDGWIETRQLAHFLRGLFEVAHGKQGSRPHWVATRFPSGEVTDYAFLSALALLAKRALGQDEHLFFCAKSIAREDLSIAPVLNGACVGELQDPWDEVEVASVRLADTLSTSSAAGPESKSNSTALGVAVARLVERCLTYCLWKWPIQLGQLSVADQNHLARIDNKWTIEDFDRLVGQTLGCDSPRIGLIDLLDESGASRPRDPVQHVSRLLFTKRGTWIVPLVGSTVFKERRTFLPLIVANTVAARCNSDHVFRRLPARRLLEVVAILNGAYTHRSREIAHDTTALLDPYETEFWARAVRHSVMCLYKHAVKSG